MLESFTPAEYLAGAAKDYKVIDVLPTSSIPGAHWVELGKVNGPLEGIDKDEKLLLVCNRGKRGYFLQSKLKFYGYTNTKVLEGGVTFNQVKVPVPPVLLCLPPRSSASRVWAVCGISVPLTASMSGSLPATAS